MKIKIFLLSFVCITYLFSCNEVPIKFSNDRMDDLQDAWYNSSWNNPNEGRLTNYIDTNGFLLAHRFCGYKWCQQGGFRIMPFIYQSRVGIIALKMLQTLSWDRKEPRPENITTPKNNILYNLLSNMSYSSNITDPQNNQCCDPMKYFFPEFKNTVDHVTWYLYLRDLEDQRQQNSEIDSLLNDQQFQPLFFWLKNGHNWSI